MMAVDIITDYVITKAKLEDNSTSLTHLKLQKILYYIQAWSLGINGKALFDGEFQAWVHGPVCRTVYNRFCGDKMIYSEINLIDRKDPSKLEDIPEKDRIFIDYILENYLGFSGAELEEMTHQEKPWIEARKGVGMFDRSENIISSETMKTYYGDRWEEITRS